MSDTTPDPAHQHHAHVVVHRPLGDEVAIAYRNVDILGTRVGKAYRLEDVV
ncbi:hypothetical protein ABIA33_003385 [Streptacidiphilus sp. MAP12-16]|uniref:hypothetical protein n=1 Tax=Streptacidiphilus sp. MAP12-16 TaxID=3156300 RepID=UPI003518DA45